MDNKPPLGIKPKWVWKAQRAEEIRQAIQRYLGVGMVVPIEWITEWNELMNEKFKQS